MRYSVSILIILLAFFGMAAAGDADTVALKEKAAVSGEYLFLGDIASVQGPHEKELAALPLMKAPRTIAGVTLSPQFVSARIKERLPDVSLRMEGAPRVIVNAQQARISGAELEPLFRNAVMGSSPYKDRCTVEISDVKAPPFVSVPVKDKDHLQAKFAQGEDFLGMVTATISAGDNPREICRITGKVKVMAQVPVARGMIRRGAIIAEGDIELKPWDVSSSPLLIADIKECLGMRAKTTLTAGKPLLRSNVAQPPLISRGDIVAIQARADDLMIMDRGIALKDGYLNERIPIRNAGSGKQVVGTIIAHSLVEVTF
jgi:flagella basal body P-ring formation protein FlgA